MTKKVTRQYLKEATLKELMHLLRVNEMVLECEDLTPEEARKLLATRLSGLDIGPNVDDILLDGDVEDDDRFNEAIELIDASSLLIA